MTVENPVRVVDAFVEQLDLEKLGFEGMHPEATGRPAYHPSTLLKIYLYGYLNRVQSSRRLERETQRNVELMWLTGRLAPDFKTISNFRKDNGPAIRGACRQFMELCRQLNLFSQALVAVDGSKFKAASNRGRNFTTTKVQGFTWATVLGKPFASRLASPKASSAAQRSKAFLSTSARLYHFAEELKSKARS